MTGKKKALIVSLVVFLAGASGYLLLGKAKDEMLYKETAVTRGSIAITILSTGTVSPENRLEIKPPIAGRVEEVLVDEGQMVKKGQILAWMSSSERAALLDAARAEGPAEVNRWKQLYRPTPVMAPISGTIILRNVESGQTFASTDSILSMSDRLTVKAQVDETDIAQVKVKQVCEIVLDAYSGQSITGKVDKIKYDAKTVNNVTTYEVDVLPDQTPEYMRSGMTANVTFQISNKEGILIVPTQALKNQNGANSVLVKADNGKTVEREVEIGLSDGRVTEVVGGLKEGEIVAIPQSSRGKAKGSPFSPMGQPKSPPGKGR